MGAPVRNDHWGTRMHVTDRTDAARAEEEQAGGFGGLLGALYAEHHAQALVYARSLTSCPGLAEDLVSEAFLRTWLRIRNGVVLEHPRAYLFTSIRNLSIDMVRRSSKVQACGDFEQVQEASAPYAQTDDVEVTIERIDLQRALASLAPAHAQVLRLTLLEGLSNAEVAARMGCKSNTISSLSYRARRALAQHLLAPARPARPVAPLTGQRLAEPA